MAENYRALVAILLVAIPALFLLRRPLVWFAIQPADYVARACLWVLLTIALFLAPNFWFFVFVAMLTVLAFASRDSNPPGLYLFVLLVAPPFSALIPGVAGINYFIAFDYLRLLSVAVLFPYALTLSVRPDTPGLFKLPADKFILGYIGLLLALQAPLTSNTDLLRALTSHFIDALLPYYVFSRGLREARQWRDAVASLVAACAVVAVLALFEFGKQWLLYAALRNALDVQWNFGGYMFREGVLRATVSTGHSIVLGYVMVVGLGLHLALRSWFPSRTSWWVVTLLLGAGLLASVSRGPWVGAAAMIAISAAMAPKAPANLAKASLAAVIVGGLAMATPLGSKIISVLPFIGTSDSESVVYRQQLLQVSWDVLMLNPVFGSPHYLANAAMEQLRTVEGMIDMVNSYLGVALSSGLVGLTLFVGAFVTSAVRLRSGLLRARREEGYDDVIGRALLAALIGALVTIYTVSSINVIPVIYWCLAGACAGYARRLQGHREPEAQARAFTTPEPRKS